MKEQSVDSLVKQFVTLRDHRSGLEKQKVQAKKVMDKIGLKIMELADAQGVTSFATPHGTAFKTTKDWIKVSNWDVVLDFIIDGDLKHLLPQSVKKAAVKEYMEENEGKLPPGLEYGEQVEIGVRRK
jgi:hypothetical protein